DELMLDRELRLLIDVDHLEVVVAVQVLLAQPGDVAHRAPRFLGVPGDEQSQHVIRLGVFDGSHGHHGASPVWSMSSPSRTRWVSDRSPMMRRIGSGSSRIRVGMATIWWRCASAGSFIRSMMSTVQRPGRYRSHSLRILAIAAMDFGVWPAT